ncbi:Cu-Zn family superoxide dismutase [Altererythrobacter atlanticus]|uniref:Superoxide dismutase-like protein YojM n=1 Tax=Croceibacterium atlanticum TaxID=1267766 RepID=A0A0F7KV13_9SPHN|nr:superoxide dismutase family protein [Croceibacterium atlanticum]AKH43474.1 Superoxide dismutase-like protein YojM precursor [Croceibacterium atlanticum]MBB5731818.1 Cu-Zn family superoxide dismutase [Croceibacterium atlanticum]
MKRSALLALSLAAALSGCKTMDEQPSERLGHAVLIGTDGTRVGTARLLSRGSVVNISVAITGLPQGRHAVHLHTIGACDAPDFASAGAHLNPGGRQHGFENPAGAHLGDLPNVTLNAAGAGTMSATLEGLRAELLPQIFDLDGTAVVVHQLADDYATDPSGAAGSRIACGVFMPE